MKTIGGLRKLRHRDGELVDEREIRARAEMRIRFPDDREVKFSCLQIRGLRFR